MSCILLFNIKDENKLTAVRLTAMRFGVPCFEIRPEQQGQTIEALLKLLAVKEAEFLLALVE